jgi:hypothetical protein
MKIFLLSFILILFYTVTLSAQVTQEWVARYNGTGSINDESHSIAVDSIGNVYVTGSSDGNWLEIINYVTIKYNSSGVQQWARIYNGTGSGVDRATSIAVDILGNVYVTGTSTGIGTYGDYATIKYNSLGDSLWVRRYNGTGNNDDWATEISVDGLGNVYVTGRSSVGALFDDYATIKYNSSGVQQWIQKYNGPGNNADIASSIAVDFLGNVYVTGRSAGNGTSYDYATIKYNTDGVQQWVQRYNGPENSEDDANSIALDNSGNIYVTGKSMKIGSRGFDYATIKYNSSGVQLWVQRYNEQEENNNEASSISVDISGNVFVTGKSTGYATSSDYATIKYNADGVQQWVQRYTEPGSGIDAAYSITIDGLGNSYVTGASMKSETGVYDYATIKYNSSGVQQWVQRYNGPGNGQDFAYSIVIDGSRNVYITGQSTGIGTSADYATIKYSQQIGIQPISSEIPKSFSLSQNYPNPFNPSTKIKFDIPQDSRLHGNDGVLLVVYDILGREVSTLVNEQLKPGTYEVEFDGTNYSSGMYFYKLTTESFNETRKMVLLK